MEAAYSAYSSGEAPMEGSAWSADAMWQNRVTPLAVTSHEILTKSACTNEQIPLQHISGLINGS